MANAATIVGRSEARILARNRVGKSIGALFPSHPILILNENFATKKEPYIGLRILTDGKTNPSGVNMVPITLNLKQGGVEDALYHVTQSYLVKFYKKDAMTNATLLLEMLSNKKFQQTWFGDILNKDGETLTNIGITNISDNVTDSPTSICFGTKWEEGATISFDVNYLFKRTTGDMDTISTIEYTNKTISDTGDVVQNGTAYN
jgi:hypothetical protein